MPPICDSPGRTLLFNTTPRPTGLNSLNLLCDNPVASGATILTKSVPFAVVAMPGRCAPPFGSATTAANAKDGPATPSSAAPPRRCARTPPQPSLPRPRDTSAAGIGTGMPATLFSTKRNTFLFTTSFLCMTDHWHSMPCIDSTLGETTAGSYAHGPWLIRG